MKEFVLLFRMDITSPEAQPDPEQMKIYMADWMQWINGIAAKHRLAEGGNHFSPTGVVLRPNNVMEEMPYTADKQSVAGYLVVLAKDMNDALLLAKECPILNGENTSVEVRETASPLMR